MESYHESAFSFGLGHAREKARSGLVDVALRSVVCAFTTDLFVYSTEVFKMALSSIVMKFGGTSVEDAAAFARVAKIVASFGEAHPIVVVSAMSRVTDALLKSVREAKSGSGPEAALRQLTEHLERHTAVASTLLSPEESSRIENLVHQARIELGDILHQVATPYLPLLVLQDVVLSLRRAPLRNAACCCA
ncbi:MAG: hypothetical protein WKF84_19290 [Pyrinomonadaceae bacterium]